MRKKHILKKMMSTLLTFLLVLGVVPMGSGVAFAEESGDNTITVTIHFSSVDGDDLMDPIKITSVAPGTTLEEAVEGAIKDEVIPQTLFVKEGYRYWGSLTPKPLSYYAARPLETWWDEMYADRNAAEATELYEDKDFYAHMYKYVDTPIFVTVDAPKCGVETATPEKPNPEGDHDRFDWESQTNLPVMTFKDSSKEILDLYSTWARWINEEDFVSSESYVPFNGKFVGGEKYYIDITFDPKPGLLFSEKSINDSEIEVPGDVEFDIVDSFYMPFMAGLTIAVPAEHVPGEWEADENDLAKQVKKCTGCGKVLETRDKPVHTVTLHFSSIDGDDLEEPIVVENIPDGTTLKAAIEGSGRECYGTLFEKDGYQRYKFYVPEPFSHYLSMEDEWYTEMRAANVGSSTAITEDMELYIPMVKHISVPIEATITAPKCGTETNTEIIGQYDDGRPEYDWDNQTNYPLVIAKENAEYAGGELYASWIMEDNESAAYIGKFVGDEYYYADVWFESIPGYGFMKGDEVKVNGGEVLDPFVISPSYYEMTVRVQAQHDWGEWTVAKEPTATEEGEETRICTGCHKEEKRSIPAKGSENKGDDKKDNEEKNDDSKSDDNKNDEKKNESKNEAPNTIVNNNTAPNNAAAKSASVSRSPSTAPKTGDENRPWLYAVLLLASLMVMGLYTNRFSRCNSKRNDG